MPGSLRNIVLLIVILISVYNTPAYSQKDEDSVKTDEKGRKLAKTVKNPVGKEFWLCFERNYKETGNSASDKLMLELFITGDYDAKVKITIEAINYKMDTLVPAETVVNIKLPPSAQVVSSEINENLAVHITSNKPVSVYGLNRRFQTTDTYLGLPVDVLGKEYRALCFQESEGLLSQMAIVATENNTDVSIVPTANTLTHPKGIEFSIKMQKGEVFQIIPKFEPFNVCDLTGTLVKANKKISVFSGHQCSYVPDNVVACNHLVEQMPPLPSWGRHFYLGKFHSRNRYTYRVLAHQNDTKIFVDNKLVKTLKAGEFFDEVDKKNIQLTATKPILVAQFSHGFSDGDSIGDPMMILVSPTQQFLQLYRFATPVNGSWNHFINVVVPTTSINTLRLDGGMISSSDFKSIGISRYSIGQIKVPFGSHTIEGEEPFGMYSYGFGYKGSIKDDAYDAYGTMGGQSFIEYEVEKDTIPPTADIDLSKDTTEVIIRDDRIEDSGIREIRIIENFGLEGSIDKIFQGMPQAAMKVTPIFPEIAANMVIEAIDMALNKSYFTICYNFDKGQGQFSYKLTEGKEVECEIDPGIQIGLFGKMSANMNFSDFSTSGDLKAGGNFSEDFAFGGYGGIIIGRHIRADQIITARMIFESNPAVLIAPDTSNNVYVNDPITGEKKLFQEQTSLTSKLLFLNTSFGYEWYLKNRMYFTGGLNIAFTLSKEIEVRRKILIPNDYVYLDNSTEHIDPDAPKSLSTIKTLRLGVFAGIGFNYNINYTLSLFAEGIYNHYFGNLINDGDWTVEQLSIQLGFRYRFLK